MVKPKMAKILEKVKGFGKNLVELLTLKNNFLFFVLILACLVISYQYRNRFYWSYPPIAETFDEFAYAWLGLSLFETGIPTSWSFIPDYIKGVPEGARLNFEGTRISVDGVAPTRQNFSSFPKPIMHVQEFDFDGYRSQFNLVMPYLEQPPLGGLIISLPLILTGEDDFSQISLFDIRKQFPLIGTIATLLVIIIGNIWYGRRVALTSGFLYATVPTIVLGSRLALPENILVPVLLAQIIFLELYERDKKRVFVLLAYLIAFFAPLIKPFGFSAALVGAIFFILRRRNFKEVGIFVLLGLFSFLTYAIYAISYDRNTFFSVLAYQSSRFFSGPHILLYKILIPKITKIFLDGWIFFGWLALGILAFRNNSSKHTSLMLSFFSYLFVIAFFGGENFGWYRFPLYPFLLISAGYLIVEILKKPLIFASLLFIGTGAASSFAWGLGIYDWSPYLLQFRIFIVIASLILGFQVLFKSKYSRLLASGFLFLIFIASLYLNTRVINRVAEIWPRLGDDSSLIIGRR